MGVVANLVSHCRDRPAGRQGAAFATGIAPATFSCLLLGMFLAFAAVWPEPRSSGAPARLLVLHLPGWLAGSLVIALAATSLSLLASLLPAPRRKDPEDFVLEPPPPPKGGWMVGLVMFALLLIGAAATVSMLQALDRNIFLGGGATPVIHSLSPLRPSPPPRPAPPRIGMKAADLVLMLGAATLTLAALSFAAWMAAETRWQLMGFGRRRKRPRSLAAAVAEAVEAGLAELASEDDPRRAVIACYRRCEAAIASATHRRYPWQTPREYLKVALDALSLPTNPTATLLGRFERARFGNEPVGLSDRDAAAAALENIRVALREKGAHGNRR